MLWCKKFVNSSFKSSTTKTSMISRFKSFHLWINSTQRCLMRKKYFRSQWSAYRQLWGTDRCRMQTYKNRLMSRPWRERRTSKKSKSWRELLRLRGKNTRRSLLRMKHNTKRNMISWSTWSSSTSQRWNSLSKSHRSIKISWGGSTSRETSTMYSLIPVLPLKREENR